MMRIKKNNEIFFPHIYSLMCNFSAVGKTLQNVFLKFLYIISNKILKINTISNKQLKCNFTGINGVNVHTQGTS